MDRWIDMREDTTRTRGRAHLVCTLVGLIMIGRSGRLGCELGSLLRHRKCTEGMSSISQTSTRTHTCHTHTHQHTHIYTWDMHEDPTRRGEY
jgi:N-acetyl-gamma-glutamylphosphate reductase